MAEWLALPMSDHKVLGSNPAGGRIQLMTVWCILEQSHSLSPFRYLNMTILERDMKHQIIITQLRNVLKIYLFRKAVV